MTDCSGTFLYRTQRAGPHSVSAATVQPRTAVDVIFTANGPITKIRNLSHFLSGTTRKFPCSRALRPEPDHSNLQPHAPFHYVVYRLGSRSLSLAPFQPDLFMH
jgi:hypothetical protein